MKKVFIHLVLAAIIIAGVAGVYQWQIYKQKIDIREDALLYFGEEDYAKTIEYLQEALKLKSFFADEIDQDMTCYMAESYYQLEEYDQAVEIYNRLLKASPKNSEYYQLKGQCYQGEKSYDKAIEVYENGWKNTKDSHFLEMICDIYIQQEDYEKALQYAQEGIKDSGNDAADFMYETVIIYEKSEDYASAYDAVCEYCEQYPDDERAQREKTFLSTRI